MCESSEDHGGPGSRWFCETWDEYVAPTVRSDHFQVAPFPLSFAGCLYRHSLEAYRD
jgi:hypothetical protein